MKILVCITHVPDTTSKIQFTANNTKFDPTGVQFIIGPYDDYALARAVELRDQTGGTLTALNVGEAETEPTLRKALAIGADDAIRVNSFPKDSFFVAKQIANLIQSKQAKGEKCVLGLATGSTPIKMYAELVRLHKEEGLSFKNVISFKFISSVW